jgi:ABC-type microcin C transport system permease subunit YejB
MLPVIMVTEMESFFNILIYGDASFLFLLIFIGIGYAIAMKYKGFALVVMVICLFQAIAYSGQTPNIDYIWHIILLLVTMLVMAFRMGDVSLFG